LAEKWKCPFFETSALARINVEEAIYAACMVAIGWKTNQVNTALEAHDSLLRTFNVPSPSKKKCIVQ
jgi:hypothetical protein